MKSIICFHFFFGLAGTATAETITISLKRHQNLTEELHVALFDSAESFPEGEPLIGVQKHWSNSEMEVVFNGIKPGKYAVAAYIDQDGNQSLGKNFLGIPTEPYNFSGQVGFGQPFSEEASFQKDAANRSVDISLGD